MNTHMRGVIVRLVLVASLLLIGPAQGIAVAQSTAEPAAGTTQMSEEELREKNNDVMNSRVSQEQREAAAVRAKVLWQNAKVSGGVSASAVQPTPNPGGIPDYFGTPDPITGRPVANWAFSPLLRKFVDTLPGVGPAGANNLGNYIGVAHPDTVTYPGSDYYEIELREYEQQLHSDLPPTRLRGYVQVNNGTDPGVANPTLADNTVAPDPIGFLGPFVYATKDRPVRVKFTNKLPIGDGGDLFIPVDTSVMGAGIGPDETTMYTQNRATLHLHGGVTPWISDGTPHQWITPAGEDTNYPKGVSVKNVPDMPDPGDGSMTFYYSNQQSARLMWVHDHSYGITRLNVYVGEVMPYAITDDVEADLIARGIIPDAEDTIPLVVQDKTFVDAETIGTTDPTWNWGSTPPYPHTGDLWMPHVYVPAQNPADPGGMNATGRWHYGPWFWPPTSDIDFPPIPNPYYVDAVTTPWENPTMPATPNPSMGMEAFQDTPVVNGVAYPTVTVDPKAYRLRILNGASDRFFNLQMYTADPTVITSDGRTNTEVKMIPAAPTPEYDTLYPDIVWPSDGRSGGAPDPAAAGPEWVQIANESGFLPAPVVVPQQPITWNGDPTTFNVGNVQDHSLLIAPAERADVIVDFSAYAGQTIIVYNDAPTAFPALDQRTDYFTGGPDFTDTGGTFPTEAGFGPNTRTVMQIKVAAAAPAPAFDLDALNAEFVSTGPNTSVFERGQHPITVPDARYEAAYDNAVPFVDSPYVRIYENLNKTFQLMDGTSITLPLEPKAIQDEMGESFDQMYGRMSGNLGLQIPGVGGALQNFILYGFLDPPTEILTDQMSPLSPVLADGTQIWRITHNGVDTHPIHFHLQDVQLINRVGWDGALRPPDDNELGWKETVRVSPLEDTIVALKPVAPKLPFGVPDSWRALDVTMPLGTTDQFAPWDPLGQPRTVTNELYNFGWEYVWHCHILSHEEMDMMRPVTLAVDRAIPDAPNPLAASGDPGSAAGIDLTWVDPTPVRPNLTIMSSLETTAEVGFRVERAPLSETGVAGDFETIKIGEANSEAFTDLTTIPGRAYRYRIVTFNAALDPTLLGASNEFDIFPAGDVYFDSFVTTPTAGPGGSISPATPSSVPVSAPADLTFDFTPDPGYHVADVLLDDVSVGAPASYTILAADAADHTIHVTFAINEYPITPTAGANGRIWWTNTQNPDPGGPVPPAPQADPFVQHAVELQTFVFVPDPGYQIADVLVNGVSILVPGQAPPEFYTFSNVTGPNTIHVDFELQTFTITPSASAGGSIAPASPQTVVIGTDQTFTMTADPGYHLSELRIDGALVPTASTYTFTNVQADHTIAATFVSDRMLPIYRFYNLLNGSHFYTASQDERDMVVVTWPGVWAYEGVAYSVNLDNPANDDPLYRFYNRLRGTHFYTASLEERDMVIATWPDVFTYEGIAYNISATEAVDTMPVYRFYNVRTGSHFYTASAGERDTVIATWPGIFTYEGVAFYVGY
ncbi:MAG: multicopper oxidase domain-containing protein [Coriobacteriia bacterium]|nr:multicopper oxidase domain-containing protein [Coriobacteriia bacterium]